MTPEEQPPLETGEESTTEHAVAEQVEPADVTPAEIPAEPTNAPPAESPDAEPIDAEPAVTPDAEPTNAAQAEAPDAELTDAAPAETPDAELDDAIAQLSGEPESASTAVVSDEVAQAVEESRHDSVSAWPFAAYVAVWVLFSAFVVWRFIETPADTALYEVPLYRWVVIGGVALTIAGPLLALGVWLAAIRHPDAERGALFASALFKGAIATFAGVCVWWASLLILDQIRIGSVL